MFNSKKIITCIDYENYSKNTSQFSQNSTNFESILSFAQLLSCLNNLQSCAYINTSISNHPQISLLEQLFLRTNLRKEYPYIHIDYYLSSKNNTLTRGIVSQAEFQNMTPSKLIEFLKFYRYDYIIFDNLTIESPFFNLIEKILKDNEILSQIVIITNSKTKKYLRPILTNNFKYTTKNILPYSSNFSSRLKKESTELNIENGKIDYINSPLEISVWIQIAYNFTELKNKNSKRFFFLSTQMQSSREVAFISILKKMLKEMHDFGNWDFINLNLNRIHSNENLAQQNSDNQLISILKQSLFIDGITNIAYDLKSPTELIQDVFKFQDISQIISKITSNTNFDLSNTSIKQNEIISIKEESLE